jgi:glycosyltransferase involved in cell wall biosynthesis
MKPTLIIYAPNINTGGGLILLNDLLRSWTGGGLTLFLDFRAAQTIDQPNLSSIHWVRPNPISRLVAEFKLHFLVKRGDRVLCFHGLPPVLSNLGEVYVFLQNRLYVSNESLAEFAFKTRWRIRLERMMSRIFRSHASLYVVQTPSMQEALCKWIASFDGGVKIPKVEILPFMAQLSTPNTLALEEKCWDFIYVADGEAHKNHKNLIIAWQILAKENLRPSLCLTLDARYDSLKNELALAIEESGLNISDLGKITRDQVIYSYTNARALIFPSMSESFGLPLLEAVSIGLPILASELDYVRDVCIPDETFDPESPVSISRAVKRFLGCIEHPISPKSPAEFWHCLNSN